MRRKTRIALVGRHSHRTLASYTPYRRLAAGRLEFVGIGASPDIALTGFFIDVKENFRMLLEAKRRQPDLRIAVVSEEPLWDTVWTGDYRSSRLRWEQNGEALDCENYNHFNSDLFQFDRYPYFITTDDSYFVRYSILFRQNRAVGKKQLKQCWASARYWAAFIAEHRLDSELEIDHGSAVGLSVYRTKLAELSRGNERVLVSGRGWGDLEKRQQLADWHLDKLGILYGSAAYISAIENTHQDYYVTEKIFDAYACLGIPLYWHRPGHSVAKICDPESYLNLSEFTPGAAVEYLKGFQPTDQHIDCYLETQARLCTLFSQPEAYQQERANFLKKFLRLTER